MNEKVTQEWVLLKIEKSAKHKLDVKTFKWVVGLLVPVIATIIGFLTNWLMKLDDRLDGLSVLVQELAVKIQFLLCK